MVRIEFDLDVEEGRPLALLRLGRDPRQASCDDVVGQGADLHAAGHSDRYLADVDLIHGALEDQVTHVGDVGQLGAGLVRGQRDHGVSDIDRSRQHRTAFGGSDDGLDLGFAPGHPPAASEILVVMGLLAGDPRELESLSQGVEFALGHQPALVQFPAAFVIGPRLLEARLRRADAVIHVEKLLRGWIGGDLEERVTGADLVADLHEAALDDPRDLRLDLELLARFDLAHRQRLLRNGTDLRLDQHVAVLITTARADPRVDSTRHAGHDHRDHQQSQYLCHARPPLFVGPPPST